MNNQPITLPVIELKPALTGLGKVVNRTSSLPVLTALRIDRDHDGRVSLTGTDLDSTVSVRLEQPSPGAPASLLIPFNELNQIIRNLGSSDVLSVTPVGPSTVSVRYPIGASFAEQQIESFALDEFPSIPRVEGEPCALTETIRTAFWEALQCCSSDETRLILNGVYLNVSQEPCLAATDGRHLYASRLPELSLPESVLIPSRKFLGWKAFAADGEWQLRVFKHDNEGLLQIDSRRWTFATRLIEGQFPRV